MKRDRWHSARHARKNVVRRRAPVGAAPGTLIADPAAPAPVMNAIGFGSGACLERTACEIDDVAAIRQACATVWLDVAGLSDTRLVRRLGEIFGLHDLSLEDVLNVHQRAKSEHFSSYTYIVLRMADGDASRAGEQLSLFVGDDFVVTFQEVPGDCLEPVRERLRTPDSRLSRSRPHYLAYAVIDAVVDSYFPLLERLGERLADIEDAVMLRPTADQIAEIHRLKMELMQLRRAIWPARDMVNGLIRDDERAFDGEIHLYLRDTADHLFQLIDIIETYREIASGLADVYLSATSTRLNEVMRFLTVIATVFIPLSFMASLWGMNFDRSSPFNMPELGWSYGYLLALVAMASVAGGLVWYFHHKRWLD